jgi:hypothetical protein
MYQILHGAEFINYDTQKLYYTVYQLLLSPKVGRKFDLARTRIADRVAGVEGELSLEGRIYKSFT